MSFISDLISSQDSLVLFGIAATVGALFITLLIIGYIVALRLLQMALAPSRRRFQELWRSILACCSLEPPNNLPPLRRRDQRTFLALWNHYHEILKGDARDNLITLARQVKLDAIARRQLFLADKQHRLLALLTLGNMRSREDWPLLNEFLHSSDTYVSLTAIRACFHIHPSRATTTLLPYLITRSDYPAAQVGTLLKEIDRDKLCPQLSLHMMLNLNNNSANILRYMNLCGCNINLHIFQTILDKQLDDQVVSTALSILNDPAALDLVEGFVEHPRWHIRVHTAIALGRLAKREQLPLLLQLLKDSEWWVRYRAAQALAGLPFLSTEEMEALLNSLDDRYAQDILKQALAEGSV